MFEIVYKYSCLVVFCACFVEMSDTAWQFYLKKNCMKTFLIFGKKKTAFLLMLAALLFHHSTASVISIHCTLPFVWITNSDCSETLGGHLVISLLLVAYHQLLLSPLSQPGCTRWRVFTSSGKTHLLFPSFVQPIFLDILESTVFC